MKPSFHFLRPVPDADQTYIETYGVDFEDFEPGQLFEHRPGKTITAGEAHRHDTRSLDQRPSVADHCFARQLDEGPPPVSEAYILSLMALTTKTFGKVVANLSMTEVEMAPILVGDTLYLESEILGKRPSGSRPDQGILHIETRGRNQRGEQVLRYQRKLLIYRRGQGPYQAAGY